MRYFKIYLENTIDFFTYSTKDESIEIGDRVLVNFRNKKRVGLVVEEEKETNFSFKVLEISEKLSTEISFSKRYIDLLLWIKDYYLCSFDQVFTSAVPTGMKIKYEDFYILKDESVLFNEDEIIKFFLEKKKLSQQKLVIKFGKDELKKFVAEGFLIKEKTKYFLSEKENTPEKLREYFFQEGKVRRETLERKFEKKSIEKLLKKEKISLEREIKNFQKEKFLEEIEEKISNGSSLNEEQKKIKEGIENSPKKYSLIRGVTGSGKTEIYIHLIREALKKGRGSIFLVPEISLTPQMVIRFQKEFGESIAVLHSRMTNDERAKEWYSLYMGVKKVVLGVRSAIFSPVKDLAYIIIDEEHENSYKQDNNPRYNAKMVAIKRGELEGAKVILGSATPDIESYYYGQKGIFQLYELEKRYSDAKLPKIKIVDMKEEENQFFSKELIRAIREKLLKKEQIILLLNRKGYSTLVQCESCGHMEECEHCSVKLNFHMRDGRLKCSHCGISKKFTGKCSKCGSSKLILSGRGVERVEEELRKIFPVSIIRVDGEVAKEKDFYDRMYREFLDGKYDIMVGTQMITKGLHFPNVTLVGVINSDTMMNIPDFRAGEKTYQMMTQVSGRAGRGEKEGEVIIQTYQPENYVIEKIQENSYLKFYENELEKRDILFYPPFSKIINIGISSEKEEGLETFCNLLKENIKDEKIEMYGPMPALVYRVKNRFRYNIFIKGERLEINRFKKTLLEKIKKIEKKEFRVVVDIDPINLI